MILNVFNSSVITETADNGQMLSVVDTDSDHDNIVSDQRYIKLR